LTKQPKVKIVGWNILNTSIMTTKVSYIICNFHIKILNLNIRGFDVWIPKSFWCQRDHEQLYIRSDNALFTCSHSTAVLWQYVLFGGFFLYHCVSQWDMNVKLEKWDNYLSFSQLFLTKVFKSNVVYVTLLSLVILLLVGKGYCSFGMQDAFFRLGMSWSLI
jgi:hypothetical protein